MYGAGAAQGAQLRVYFLIGLFSHARGVAYSHGDERGAAAISAGRFGGGGVMLRLAAFLCGLLVAFDTALPIGVNLRTADLVSVICLGLFCWTLLAAAAPADADHALRADRLRRDSAQLRVHGIRVEEPGQIGPALRRTLQMDEPVVVDVVTNITSPAPEPWEPKGE